MREQERATQGAREGRELEGGGEGGREEERQGERARGERGERGAGRQTSSGRGSKYTHEYTHKPGAGERERTHEKDER